jgi:hypothetical protein
MTLAVTESPPLSPVEAGLRALRGVVASGLLRCALPRSAGGDGAPPSHLRDAAAQWLQSHPDAARVLWAQRLAVEALARTFNAGLREYLLPDMLTGDRAGCLPFPLQGAAPLTGRPTARGWRLDGSLDDTPNLQWVNCSVIVPLRLDGHEAGWVLLRGEEDGLRLHRLSAAEAPPCSRSARVEAVGVFFREDEWLGGADFMHSLAPVEAALSAAMGPQRGCPAAMQPAPSGSAQRTAPSALDATRLDATQPAGAARRP